MALKPNLKTEIYYQTTHKDSISDFQSANEANWNGRQHEIVFNINVRWNLLDFYGYIVYLNCWTIVSILFRQFSITIPDNCQQQLFNVRSVSEKVWEK